MFDADHALLPGPVPGHPGDRASAAHPVQEAGGRRGGAERAVQLRLSVFLLATRVAEGRRVLDVMAVSIKKVFKTVAGLDFWIFTFHKHKKYTKHGISENFGHFRSIKVL